MWCCRLLKHKAAGVISFLQIPRSLEAGTQTKDGPDRIARSTAGKYLRWSSCRVANLLLLLLLRCCHFRVPRLPRLGSHLRPTQPARRFQRNKHYDSPKCIDEPQQVQIMRHKRPHHPLSATVHHKSELSGLEWQSYLPPASHIHEIHDLPSGMTQAQSAHRERTPASPRYTTAYYPIGLGRERGSESRTRQRCPRQIDNNTCEGVQQNRDFGVIASPVKLHLCAS